MKTSDQIYVLLVVEERRGQVEEIYDQPYRRNIRPDLG